MRPNMKNGHRNVDQSPGFSVCFYCDGHKSHLKAYRGTVNGHFLAYFYAALESLDLTTKDFRPENMLLFMLIRSPLKLL